MVISTHQHIRTRFGSRVRRAWIIGRFFGKKSSFTQRTIYFICRNVVKTFVAGVRPIGFSYIQQIQGAQDVGFHKGQRITDGAIYMGFGSQVNDPIELEFVKQTLYQIMVADIPFPKNVVGCIFYIGQVGQIPCVSQQIQVDNAVLWIVFDQSFDQVGADEASAAGDKYIVHVIWVRGFEGSKVRGFED